MEQINVDKNTPEKKFRASPLTATVWANEVQTKEGETRMYRTVSLERSYKDKEGSWKSTNSLRISDLPKATLLLNKVFEYVSFKDEPDLIGEE